jgi:hypothetical protein
MTAFEQLRPHTEHRVEPVIDMEPCAPVIYNRIASAFFFQQPVAGLLEVFYAANGSDRSRMPPSGVPFIVSHCEQTKFCLVAKGRWAKNVSQLLLFGEKKNGNGTKTNAGGTALL